MASVRAEAKPSRLGGHRRREEAGSEQVLEVLGGKLSPPVVVVSSGGEALLSEPGCLVKRFSNVVRQAGDEGINHDHIVSSVR